MEYDPTLPWYRRLHWQVLAAMALGLITGWAFGLPAANAIGWIGELFMKLLRMIIVPLVLTSIVSGVASVGGGRAIGRLFSKTMGYYVLSSMLAALTGLLMVNLIRPGRNADMGAAAQQEVPELSTPDSPVDLILDIVPSNFFALITRMVGETGFDRFAALAKYFATIGSGLTIHLFITMPLLLIVLGRIKPLVHFANLREPLLTAFSTSSSGATLPVTIKTLREKVGVSNKVSSFVLPMGATVNMDGTAIFECAGALFIAQVLGVDLSIGQQAIVVLTALLASIGAAAGPSAGGVVVFIVLNAIGLGDNPEAITIVGAMLAIDRPLDMYRTAVNVFSDSCGAAIIARSEGEEGVDTEVRH